MSSITILQEYDRFVYFVDIAQSVVINDTIYRVRGANVQKTHAIAKDIVFLSGNDEGITIILKALPDMVDINGHIYTSDLQAFLRKSLPPINDINSKCINGIVIMSIVDGKTLTIAMKQSYEHFGIISFGPPTSGIDIHTDGFDNVQIGEIIIERNKANIGATGKSDIIKDVFDTYNEHYSEGVGGKILMYQFDATGPRLLHTEQLTETGLKYIHNGGKI